MQHQRSFTELFGETLGFLVGYFTFTTVLIVVLALLSKLPASWTYGHVMAITVGVTVLGWITQKVVR